MPTCSRSRLWAVWPILIIFSDVVVSRSICTENVTMSTAAEAQSLRERCTVLDGSITLPGNLSESINLDGIEEITGDFMMDFDQHLYSARYYGPPYEISSSTLKTVGGQIYFGLLDYLLAYPEDYQAPSLGNVSFPSVMNISAGLQIAAPNVTYIDLTNLQYFTFFALATPRLEELKLTSIKGFNDNFHYVHNIDLESIGNIESIDGLFSEPVNQTSPRNDDMIWQNINFGNQTDSIDYVYNRTMTRYPYSTYANGTAPNLRNLSIGWEHIDTASFINMNLTLTLGATMTESMKIKYMDLQRGVYNLERNRSVQNLTVGSFNARNDFNNTDLVLPFDQVEEVHISSTYLRSVTIPQQAENWARPVFELHATNLRLDNSTTWHWPLKFESLVIEAGVITDDFFESFLERKTEIVSDFLIVDHSKTLDCSKLNKKVHNKSGWTFHCEGINESNVALSITVSRTLGLWALSLAIIPLLW
ncbi:hypothetical protein F5Y03DRAFT_249083 [Xylaria venustula]|nr:hypothetical protein F5Y03DRAFT_249083 [Xylaria venustula]